MEIFQSIVDLLKSALWPAVAVWVIWYLKDNIKDFLIKHKDTEVRVTLKEVGAKQAEIESLVDEVAQKLSSSDRLTDTEAINSSLARISELASEIAGLKEDLIGSLSSAAESGSNANGEYTIYNNGLLRLKLKINPGVISGRTHITFPAALVEDSAIVTFVGREQPTIIKLSGSGMVVELPESNEEQIHAIVYGFRNF